MAVQIWRAKPIRIMWVMELSLVVRFSKLLSVFMVQINSSDPAVTSHVTESAIVHVLGGILDPVANKKKRKWDTQANISLQNITSGRIYLGFVYLLRSGYTLSSRI